MALSIDDKFANAYGHISALCPAYSSFYGLLSRKSITEKDVTIRVNMLDDIHATFEYNPDFINQISSYTLSYLIVIELNRILLHHCTKRRMPDPKLNYFASNIVCCDNSNNCLLMLSEHTAELVSSLPIDTNPIIRTLLGPTYSHDKDFQLEIIYQLLAKSIPRNSDRESDGSSADGNSSSAGGNVQSSSNGKRKRKGNGNGKNSESEQTKQEREAIKQHFSTKHADKQTEKWGENDIANAEISRKVRSMNPSDWGSMPANLRDKIIAANIQVIDPRKPLKNFIATAYSNNMIDTRMKPSRRCPNLVGKVPGKRHTQEFKLGIFIDASGSMGLDDLKLAVACVNQFIRNGSIVEYAWWDCSCTIPERKLKPMISTESIGGGGTNPQCILNMIEENKLKYDGLIVITDCGFEWNKPKDFKKIFIIRTNNAIDAPEWIGKRQMTMKDVKTIMS